MTKTKIDVNRVFTFIVNYKTQHDGIAPSLREIMNACDISSTSMVHVVLNLLEEGGRIERVGGKGTGRNIAVVGGSWQMIQDEPKRRMKNGKLERVLRETIDFWKSMTDMYRIDDVNRISVNVVRRTTKK
jgi:SOS-response transcriptional repressor LexA